MLYLFLDSSLTLKINLVRWLVSCLYRREKEKNPSNMIEYGNIFKFIYIDDIDIFNFSRLIIKTQ